MSNTVHEKFVRPRFRPADSNNLLRMQVIVSFQTMIQLLENQQKKAVLTNKANTLLS